MWQPNIAGLPVNVTAMAPPILALLIGLFLFELLVYLGVQRCRFANPPRPQDPR
jgi:maltodextrin utilization protein YvdJ